MATYKFGERRRIEVRDGKIVKIGERDSALGGYAKLPKKYRAEVIDALGSSA